MESRNAGRIFKPRNCYELLPLPGHARTAIERFASNCFSSYYLTKDALTSPRA